MARTFAFISKITGSFVKTVSLYLFACIYLIALIINYVLLQLVIS